MQAFAAGPRQPTFFSKSELDLLRSLVDLILPATDSPAASTADTHYFIDLAIPACATAVAQKSFRDGLTAMGAGYATLSPAEQISRLKARAEKDMPLDYEQSFFKILKDYTLVGYFLSEIGATQALAYIKVPGGYQGDLPLAPNQKAWAI
jgi:hypothetical protein